MTDLTGELSTGGKQVSCLLSYLLRNFSTSLTLVLAFGRRNQYYEMREYKTPLINSFSTKLSFFCFFLKDLTWLSILIINSSVLLCCTKSLISTLSISRQILSLISSKYQFSRQKLTSSTCPRGAEVPQAPEIVSGCSGLTTLPVPRCPGGWAHSCWPFPSSCPLWWPCRTRTKSELGCKH